MVTTVPTPSAPPLIPRPDPRLAVAALYRFVRLDDPATLRDSLQSAMDHAGLCGTLLLAHEGINGTIAGPPGALGAFVDDLRRRHGGRFADLDVKWSTAQAPPFRRTRVRLKKEIVTLGVPEVDACDAGTHLDPAEWNRLLDDPEVTVVDTRNDYEVAIGTFAGAAGPALNPETPTFRDFPSFVARHLAPATHKKVAMFCTGGIRCEKSTALLKSRGFTEVYHLRGGILRYLEEMPEAESRWQGACFVFDRRVAVKRSADGHLVETDHRLCFACGWPTTPEDRRHPSYVQGVACPRCHDRHTPEQRARFTMRQRQLDRVQPPANASKDFAPEQGITPPTPPFA